VGSKKETKILEIMKHVGVIRPRDLDHIGIPRTYLTRLVERGVIERVGRGLYMIPFADITEHHTLVEAAKAVPHAVVCLMTALRFHDLTTQAPFEVWLAIGQKARQPKAESLPLRLFRFSRAALTQGVEEHTIEGVVVKVFSAAKTVVDCFKYRNKVGLDVAVEALRDCRRERKCSNADLWHFAKICRVLNVMRPYLEALA
jgi:predicted transcriptional regulator of viral defense system